MADEVVPPLQLDWIKLYRDRYTLEKRWRQGEIHTKVLQGHSDSVYCVNAGKGEWIVSGSRDRSIKIWDSKTGACRRTLLGHTASVLCLQFDKEILCSGSSDHTVLVWAMGTWQHLAKLKGHTGGVLDLGFDDHWIVSCSKASPDSWLGLAPEARVSKAPC